MPLQHTYCSGLCIVVVVRRKELELLRWSEKTPQYVTYNNSFCIRHKKLTTIVHISCSGITTSKSLNPKFLILDPKNKNTKISNETYSYNE